MCPAQVYEVGEADGDGEGEVKVTPSNCVQCGAITAKGGRLTPPEGGCGPRVHAHLRSRRASCHGGCTRRCPAGEHESPQCARARTLDSSRNEGTTRRRRRARVRARSRAAAPSEARPARIVRGAPIPALDRVSERCSAGSAKRCSSDFDQRAPEAPAEQWLMRTNRRLKSRRISLLSSQHPVARDRCR